MRKYDQGKIVPKSTFLHFDGTINIGTLISVGAIFLAVIVGFVKNDETDKQQSKDISALQETTRNISNTQHQIAETQAALTETVRLITSGRIKQ